MGIYVLLLSFGFNFNLNKYVPQLAAQVGREKLNYLVRHIFSVKRSILVGRPEISYYLKIVVILTVAL